MACSTPTGLSSHSFSLPYGSNSAHDGLTLQIISILNITTKIEPTLHETILYSGYYLLRNVKPSEL
jgi:hypothetical protein